MKASMYWLAFFLGLGGLYFYSNHEIHTAEQTYPPIGQFVTVDSVKLHYILQGTGQPVVFLHGSSGQVEDFSMSLFDLLPERYQAIAFDRPGHGYSERPTNKPMTVERQALLIHDALQALHVTKPILVGYSWSGALVMSYALQFPNDVKGIVTQSGYMYAEEGSSVQNYVPSIPLIGPLLLHTIMIPVGQIKQHRESRASDNGIPPQRYIHLSRALALRPGAVAAAAEDDRLIDASCERMAPEYPSIKLPFVIVTGDADNIVPPLNQGFRLHKELPQSEVIVVKGGHHDLHWTTPDAIIQAIDMIEDGKAAARDWASN
jgi:pimeloyl-ACP methyl ester carboxylesterase